MLQNFILIIGEIFEERCKYKKKRIFCYLTYANNAFIYYFFCNIRYIHLDQIPKNMFSLTYKKTDEDTEKSALHVYK